MGSDRRHAITEAVESDIGAPAALVWSVLTDIRTWPVWRPDVNSVRLSGKPGPGTQFRWTACGTPIRSRIEEFEPTQSLVWSGRTFGLRAVHTWRISLTPTGVRVRTEERISGPLVRFSPRIVQ